MKLHILNSISLANKAGLIVFGFDKIKDAAEKEKITPVTEDEIEDIRVTLDLDSGEVECEILTIFEAQGRDYIALMPLDADGNENAEGEVYLYRYAEDEQGLPQIDMIEGDEEYEIAADRFDELLDEEMYEDMED